MAGKANQMKWGEWNGQVAHVMEWRVYNLNMGLPRSTSMWNAPTHKVVRGTYTDYRGMLALYPSNWAAKANKEKWQSTRSCSLKEKGGYIKAAKLQIDP